MPWWLHSFSSSISADGGWGVSGGPPPMPGLARTPGRLMTTQALTVASYSDHQEAVRFLAHYFARR
jgi:hypothetical protein